MFFKKIVDAIKELINTANNIEHQLSEMKRFRRPSVGECQNCLFWDRSNNPSNVGKCRETNAAYGDWPIRQFDEWCGDFWDKSW